MKKNYLFGIFAMATMLFTASCQEQEVVQQGQAGADATVSINVTTPELGVSTRAFGDGTTAQTLHYAVYNVKGEGENRTRTYLPELTVENHAFELSTQIDLQLVTGNTYDVIFWADVNADLNAKKAPYSIDWANGEVSVDYSNVTSNNEDYDAFFNWITIEVNGAQTESVELYRPFGQLNIGTSDKEDARKAGYTVAQTRVTVPTYETLNLWTRKVSNETTATFKLADIPTGETFPVAGYEYLAMNYLLLPVDKELVEVTFDFYSAEGEAKNRVYSAVPLRRNWRTNIYGKLMTSEVDVNIEIVPYFEDHYNSESIYNYEVWDGVSVEEPEIVVDPVTNEPVAEVTNGAQLAYIAQMLNGGFANNAPATRAGESVDYANITITLGANIDLGGENWNPINGFEGTFDGNGYTISNLYVRTEGKASAGLFANLKGYVQNLTVKAADVQGHYMTGVIVGDGLCSRIENCHVEDAKVLATPYNKDDANHVGGIVGYLSAEHTAYVKGCSVKNSEIVAYRDVAGIVGTANQASVVTGNTVENVTIVADQSCEYVAVKASNAGAIVGRVPANATIENNVEGENVTVIVKGISDADLASLVSKEGAVVNLGEGNYKFPVLAAGVTLNCEEGVVFEGNSKLNINGATVVGATFSNPTGTAADQTINGTFKNCTFTGSNALRWCYAGETCVFEDCVFSGSTYGVHFDGGKNPVTFKGCTFSGFNAFAGEIELVTIDGCTFKSNGKSNYNGANLWGSTTMINTNFEFDGSVDNEWIDAISKDKAYEFTGCTLNDGSIFNSNYIFSRNVGTKITIDGVEYTWAEGDYLVSNDEAFVSTADGLVAALEAKMDVKFMNDIKIEPASMSNAYGATGINVKYGQTIDGNDYTLNIKGAGGTWDSGINTTGGVIKNLTVTGSFRGIFINHTSSHSEKVVLENVTIGGNGTVYTLSCDQGLYQGIEATNCTFNGWTSFAKTAGEAKFVNCTFGEGSGYKYCRPYSNTEFVNCTFCPGYAVDETRATVTFTDCTWEE